MIAQHIFTNTSDIGWSTLRISPGLIKYQSILEEISLFHETRGKDEKGLVFYPLRDEKLFVIGQSAPFPAERPSYIHHNLVLDEDSFASVKQNAERFLTGTIFYTNPAQVPQRLSDDAPPIISGVRLESLAALNWEEMLDALFSGYQSTWRFGKPREQPEMAARLILARLIKALPTEILLRFPGIHTSAFPQISSRIAVRFPYYDSMQSAIRYIDDEKPPAGLSFAAAYIAEILRGGGALNMPRSFAEILNHRQSSFNTLPLIQDLLSFYLAFGVKRPEEGLNAFAGFCKNSRSDFCMPVLEDIILRYVKTQGHQRDGEYILRRLQTETPASFARITKQLGLDRDQGKADEAVRSTGESTPVAETQAEGTPETPENAREAEIALQMEHDLIFVRDLPTLEDWLRFYSSKTSENAELERLALDKYLSVARNANEFWPKDPANRYPRINALLTGSQGKKAARKAARRGALPREAHNFGVAFRNCAFVRHICLLLFLCGALLALTAVQGGWGYAFDRLMGNEPRRVIDATASPTITPEPTATLAPTITRTPTPTETLVPVVSPEAEDVVPEVSIY
ncbi:MAG: hypothetical protein LBS84_03125 [Clostridiales bacterium]|jgi:hypothetical protein|nr:hypothetical protein [Clostridiales bacterium]